MRAGEARRSCARRSPSSWGLPDKKVLLPLLLLLRGRRASRGTRRTTNFLHLRDVPRDVPRDHDDEDDDDDDDDDDHDDDDHDDV